MDGPKLSWAGGDVAPCPRSPVSPGDKAETQATASVPTENCLRTRRGLKTYAIARSIASKLAEGEGEMAQAQAIPQRTGIASDPASCLAMAHVSRPKMVSPRRGALAWREPHVHPEASAGICTRSKRGRARGTEFHRNLR
jgi:hypothetical protein